MLAARPHAADVPLPLLITGISGVVGYNAMHYFLARYPGQVVGIRQRNNWRLRGEGILECDAEDRDTLAQLFDRYQFRSILDCAGNCALKSCELDPEMAWRINVDGVQNVLDVNAGRARLVHLSVDMVYSGAPARDPDWPGYVETDPTDPVTVYGKTMVESENRVLANDPAACVLRISLPMGISFSGHAGAIDWISSRFKHHRPATLYFDELRTPTYTDCLNELFTVTLGNRLAGLYNAGGPERWTLFQIAQIINRVGGFAPELLIGCLRHEAGPIPPRAGNVSLDSSKLTRALGFEPFDRWPLEECWLPTDREWHYRRTLDLPGSWQLLTEVLHRNPRLRGTTQRAG